MCWAQIVLSFINKRETSRVRILTEHCIYALIFSWCSLIDTILSLNCERTKRVWGAAVAQYIRLRNPSCHPGFDSQANHLHFFQFKFELWHVEKTKLNKKRRLDWPFLKQRVRVLAHTRKRNISTNHSRS